MNTELTPQKKPPFAGLVYGAAFGLLFWASLIVGGSALLTGCASVPRVLPTFEPDGTNKVPRAALVVNLTRVRPASYGGWSGDCLGTKEDAASVKAALDELEIPYIHLEDEEATLHGVEDAARAVCGKVADGGLFIVYFSGHGGQHVAFGSELDGLDETICLWDGKLLDDKVWWWLRDVPAGVRVWMVTDCCNSGTNYKGVPHDYAAGARSWWRRDPDLLHWGAALDGQNAIGSLAGGFFTIALKKAYQPGMTYREWFDAAKPLVGGKQRPIMNYTGEDFRDTEAWK